MCHVQQSDAASCSRLSAMQEQPGEKQRRTRSSSSSSSKGSGGSSRGSGKGGGSTPGLQYEFDADLFS